MARDETKKKAEHSIRVISGLLAFGALILGSSLVIDGVSMRQYDFLAMGVVHFGAGLILGSTAIFGRPRLR